MASNYVACYVLRSSRTSHAYSILLYGVYSGRRTVLRGGPMSSLTSCNRCSLNAIRHKAKEDGLKVTKLEDSEWGMGGVNIYVHPHDISIKDLSGGEDGEREQFRVAWFMEISKGCCC